MIFLNLILSNLYYLVSRLSAFMIYQDQDGGSTSINSRNQDLSLLMANHFQFMIAFVTFSSLNELVFPTTSYFL